MKFRNIALSLLAILVLCSACRKEVFDLAPAPEPDIDFTYTFDDLTYTFSCVTPEVTDVRWDIQNLINGTGETFSFTFPCTGSYWIKMSGVFRGEKQSVSRNIYVSKTSPICLTDQSFADWDDVSYADFQLYGTDGFSYAKIDYDGNNIYFFVAMNTTAELMGRDEAIMNLRIDADDDSSTGYSTKSLGCEWYLEGNFWSKDPWEDWYIGNDDLEWTDVVSAVLGTCMENEGFFYFEFALPREAFGINGTSLGLFFKFYDNEWEDAFMMKDRNGNTSMHLALDKEE